MTATTIGLRYPGPTESALTSICGGAACMEHRGEDTLIWPNDWWDNASPIGVIPGRVGFEAAQAWYAGFLAGRYQGKREGKRQGFADCQAGLRALLGAGSASDVTKLLEAASGAA
jgi:hypothetical protein